jgi:hypothetical protein
MRRGGYWMGLLCIAACDAKPSGEPASIPDGSVGSQAGSAGSVEEAGSAIDAVAPHPDASHFDGSTLTDAAADHSLDATSPTVDAADAAITTVHDAGVDWTYWATHRGEARSVALGPDGTIHVACTRRISDALTRSWHVRLSSSGEPLGNGQLPDGGTAFERTQVAAVVLDAQGNAYFAGDYAGPQRYTAFVRRRNADLTWGWSHSWADELSRINAMTLDSAGRLVMAGEIYTESFIGPLALERRLATGEVDLYLEPPELANHFPLSVITDTDGNIYIAGYQYELFGEFPTSSATRGFFAKLSATGTHLYTQYLGTEANCDAPLQTRASAIALDSAGNLWVAGLDCDSEVFLRKFSTSNGAQLLDADNAIEISQDQVPGSFVAQITATAQRIRIAGSWSVAGTMLPALRELTTSGEPQGSWTGEASFEVLSAANADGAMVLAGKGTDPDALVQRVTIPD